MQKKYLLIATCLLFVILTRAQQKELFNKGWEFVKDADTVFSPSLLAKNGNIKWQDISLPHTANIEPIKKAGQQWQGVCIYRKFFSVPPASKGKHIAIQFDAAMQKADLYLNGKHIFQHLGGYLPFYVDVSDDIKFGSENSLLVLLDNRDNPLIPPGKPLKDLDFNYYSGIYRNAWLITKNKLHITNAVAANTIAGGGVFVHYENVDNKSATVVVQTQLQNDFNTAKNAQVRITLKDNSGKVVAQTISKIETVQGDSDKTFTQRVVVLNPRLWSPDSPNLYQLSDEVTADGKVVDKEVVKTGVKAVHIEAGVFYLNGKKIKIRGTNRHQDYPYIGNALSDNAQYRDAWKIKQAGFNFVRSCHYPQSPAYLDACDELGIMVMDAIPGWQFPGNDSFRVNSYQNIRDMIHRDRNHAAIVLWEASLNESGMKKEYMQKAHDIVHTELPFDNVYSAGWINGIYDVFLPARQHAKAPDYWKKYDKATPLLIAEYGDWEYYAQNAGFNQKEYKDLKPEERTSRQLRAAGQKGMLQEALNYQEAHNDNMYGTAIGDVNWLMFDYNRGYADDIQSSGIMDIQRLPKFAFYFFQSQVDPTVTNASPFNKPMLFIANYWQNASDTTVKIFSNCDEVELLLNGKAVGRQRPDTDQNSTNLKHAPFTFHVTSFHAGTLTAKGYINNKKVVESQRKTPGNPARIVLHADTIGKALQAGKNDIVFVYADVTDDNGNVVPGDSSAITFHVTGDAVLVSLPEVAAEAGTATMVLRAGANPGKINISASGSNIKSAELVLYSK
jgi:beta-galactosidase